MDVFASRVLTKWKIIRYQNVLRLRIVCRALSVSKNRKGNAQVVRITIMPEMNFIRSREVFRIDYPHSAGPLLPGERIGGSR